MQVDEHLPAPLVASSCSATVFSLTLGRLPLVTAMSYIKECSLGLVVDVEGTLACKLKIHDLAVTTYLTRAEKVGPIMTKCLAAFCALEVLIASNAAWLFTAHKFLRTSSDACFTRIVPAVLVTT